MIALKAFGGGRRRPINLFFTEIIIALLFFSISGAVILQVFAYADIRSRRSARLEKVMIIAQSVAEAYSQSGDVNEAARLATGAELSDSALTIPFEYGGVQMTAAEKRTAAGAGELSELTVTFSAGGEEIYSLTCSAYIRGGDGV